MASMNAPAPIETERHIRDFRAAPAFVPEWRHAAWKDGQERQH